MTNEHAATDVKNRYFKAEGHRQSRSFGGASASGHSNGVDLLERPVALAGGKSSAPSHPARPIRVCFLIRSLETGGAQRQLAELLKGLDKDKFAITVMTFYSGGLLSEEIENIEGLELVCLEKTGRWDVVGFLVRLVRKMRALRPDLVHGYLGTENVLAVLLKCFLRNTRVVWGVRSAAHWSPGRDPLLSLHFLAERWLGRLSDVIVVNSQAGRRYCLGLGFSANKIQVIPNGIDTQRFRPDSEGRRHVRAEWSISDRHWLIGLVGRLEAVKDHPTFLRAAARMMQEREDVRFVCVGSGAPAYAEEMRALAGELGVEGCVVWAGERKDMPQVYSALDISTSSSVLEGFSNTIAESMACGVPCAVTDVGDSANIVGPTGIVVPARDVEALAEAWKAMLRLQEKSPKAARDAARDRISMEFSQERLVRTTSAALEALL